MSVRPCPSCNGARLRPESLAVLVAGTAINEFCALSAHRARDWSARTGFVTLQLDQGHDRAAGASSSARDRGAAAASSTMSASATWAVGIGRPRRCPAGRPSGSVSRHRSGPRSNGVLYVLDDPVDFLGLHQRDTPEARRDARTAAGPGQLRCWWWSTTSRRRARRRPACSTSARSPERASVAVRTSTIPGGTAPRSSAWSRSRRLGWFLNGTRSASRFRSGVGRRPATIEIIGACRAQPSSGINVRIPLGVLWTCVTGVSGSRRGQRSVNDASCSRPSLQPPPRQAAARPGPTSRSARSARCSSDGDHPRSTRSRRSGARRAPTRPPTSGLFDQIRDLYAKDHGGTRASAEQARDSFSFNVAGGGRWVRKLRGRRWRSASRMRYPARCPSMCHVNSATGSAATAVRRSRCAYKGRTIADVLDMPIDEALDFFEHMTLARSGVACRAAGRRRARLHPAGPAGDDRSQGGEATAHQAGDGEASKIATWAARSTYLDEIPTTGSPLPPTSSRLLDVLSQELVDAMSDFDRS